MKRELPLVSILIPNYNHSRYLDQCIQSALAQTYPNKEIVLMDNNSTDDSIEVARKYIKEGVLVCKNQKNIWNRNYRMLAEEFCRGKYFILLCADDYLMPHFIENAVAIMEKYPSVGYVHGEKDFVTAEEELIETDPFYKCSFVAPGRETMSVYMVTTVAHPTQGVVRKEAFDSIGGYDMSITHMNADRSLWFYLSYEWDAAYIRDKMCRIRIGCQTETFITQENFRHPILCHLIIKEFVSFARMNNLPAVYGREEEALKRLAGEFVGYAGGMLRVNNIEKAKAYLDYAQILSRNIVEEEIFFNFSQMVKKGTVNRSFLEEQEKKTLQHQRSYEPPQGYEEINLEEIVK